MLDYRQGALVTLVVAGLSLQGCDDAVPGPIGGLVVVIRPIAAPIGSPNDEVDRVEVTYARVEAIHRVNLLDAPESKVVLDSHERTIVLPNAGSTDDVFVAQFQVPVGFVSQIRFFPTAVTLHLKSGASVILDPDSPDLPSWRNTGWKFAAIDGAPFEVRHDELSGARGLMAFDERLVREGPRNQTAKAWKIKPTLPAEPFQVNPSDDEPGVFLDQLTVVFREGVSSVRIDEINARIGARVLIMPVLGTWYRIKLPATINEEDASRYFHDQPEVSGVMPAIDFGTFLIPNDNANATQHDLIHLAEAWDIAIDAGSIGRSTVVVAVIEPDGFNIANRDLYRNVWINQGELPLALFDSNDSGVIDPSEIARYDTDPTGAPDGIITIRDLENEDGGIRPRDANSNNRVDGFDLIQPVADGGWANSVDEDQNGFADDLVGWDFANNDNNPSPDGPPNNQHGTAVASIIAAEGNNDTDIAGISWRASLIAVRASVWKNTLPAEHFAQAVRYVESVNALVVNVSSGYSFARKGYDAGCGDTSTQTIAQIKPEIWDAGVQEADREYAALFSGTRALFVFAAGNSGHFLDDERLMTLPQEAVWRAIPATTLLVGNAKDQSSNAATSHYGSAVELWAPGQQWQLPTFQNFPGTASPQDGSSLAAPAVVGAAALLASHNRAFLGNARGLKRALTTTAASSVTVVCKERSIADQPFLNVRDLLGAAP